MSGQIVLEYSKNKDLFDILYFKQPQRAFTIMLGHNCHLINSVNGRAFQTF